MRPFIGDRRVALTAGLVLVVAGAWLLKDAYERRGRSRPFLMRLVPGA
ncbi:hypothetical protein [Occultella kanbiaonis]|nr:hypothetical protein [Occultella kanbiaonis]